MILPQHSHRVARLLAVGAVAGALAAPTAAAATALEPGSLSADNDATAVAEPAPADAPVVVRTIDEGFDWGSAAIGAGVAGALFVLVALGGFTYISRGGIHVAR